MATGFKHGADSSAVHKAGSGVDIPISEVAKVYRSITDTFSTSAVVIGGRAVNFYCMHSQRPTHDIDLVVEFKPTRAMLSSLPNTPGEKGSYFEVHETPDSEARPKMFYISDVTKATLKDGKIEIDLYYPDYRAGCNRYMPMSSLNNIPLREIIRLSEVVKIADVELYVVNREMLTVMKYETWKTRGKKDKDAKDMQDLRTLVRNYYNTPDTFRQHFVNVARMFDRYHPDVRTNALREIFENLDVETINPHLRRVFWEVIRTMPETG